MRTTSFFAQIATSLLAVALILAACASPPASLAGATAAAQKAFDVWAADNGEPYRDVKIVEVSNDGVFAQMYVLAWFRPASDADWEERETAVECRLVGDVWQCGPEFYFVLSRGEIGRRSAAATATAIPIMTAQAAARATAVVKATEQAQARTTAQAIAQATSVAQATVQAQATATAQANVLAASIADAPNSAAQLGFTSIQTDAATGVISAVHPRDGAIYVYVPAGEFLMGTPIGQGLPNENPQHAVHLDAYWIMQTEVTNAQYAACVAAGECSEPQNSIWLDAANASFPVTDIRRAHALNYARWIGGSLPNEEQWEKAARGTDGRLYPWGDESPTCERLNFNDCLGYVAAAGSFLGDVSPYGALDMAGNVREWTADRFTSSYFVTAPSSSQTNPTDSPRYVVRGGSYDSSESKVRTAYRGFGKVGAWSSTLGFRIVVAAP